MGAGGVVLQRTVSLASLTHYRRLGPTERRVEGQKMGNF